MQQHGQVQQGHRPVPMLRAVHGQRVREMFDTIYVMMCHVSNHECILSLVRCPNDCSGHGRCVSMQELARISNLQETKQYTLEYGSGAGLSSTAWDYQTMHACVCDSSWVVGFGAGETQLGEYFGPDCSQSE